MLSFKEIREWFDPDDWDLGHITNEQLMACSEIPIKGISQPIGKLALPGLATHRASWENAQCCIVLIRHSALTFDYSLYNETTEILTKHGLKENVDWTHIYTNFKEAEILSGRGVRSRNSLVYNYKFGFDSKVCVIGLREKIPDPPKIKRVAGNNFKEQFWHNCIGCDACHDACPVGAIHNKDDLPWMDFSACDDFLGVSDHPRIPSMKKYWHKHVRPDVPKNLINSITNSVKNMELGEGDGKPFTRFNANGFTENPDGLFRKGDKVLSIPVCKECQIQAPCSKWGGKFPYEAAIKEADLLVSEIDNEDDPVELQITEKGKQFGMNMTENLKEIYNNKT